LALNPSSYFNFLCERWDFIDWVMEAWVMGEMGTPMFIFYRKLKSTKAKLKCVNKDINCGIFQ